MPEPTPESIDLTPDTLFQAVSGGIPVTLRLSELASYLGSTAAPPAEPEPAPGPVHDPNVLPWDRLGATPDLIVEDVEVPPGQRFAYIKVSASRVPEATAYVNHGVGNYQGGGINVGNGGQQKLWVPDHLTVWRPGDDPDHWITIDMQGGRQVGDAVTVRLMPRGFSSDSGVSLTIRIVDGAVNELPAQMPFHRAPKRLDVSGTSPAADLDIGAMSWSDTGYVGNVESDAPGAVPCWRARLAHGYSQDGNGELGAYLNTDKHPGAVNPQSVETDSQGRNVLRLHTRRLAEPEQVRSTAYYQFQASIVNGQNMPEWRARRGLYRTQCLTPDRLGAWSAFWFIGNGWPPEIDGFEHFNGAWGNGWNSNGQETSSAQHVGPHSGSQRSRVNAMTLDMVSLGFADIDLYNEIHDYAVLIEDRYITHFVDGIETLQHLNMTDAQDGNTDWTFFPMLNVAVKPPSNDDPYDQGNGDMLVYGLQRYDPDSGYQLVDFDDPKPWGNRQVLPPPG